MKAGQHRGANYRLFEVIGHVAYVGIVAHALFIPLFYFIDVRPMALLNVLSLGVWLWARHINKKRRQGVAMFAIGAEVVLHAVLAVAYLGWQSGFQYYLLPLIPFFTFNERARLRTAIGVSLLVLATLLGLHHAFASSPTHLSPTMLHVFHDVNLMVPLIALFVISYYYRVASLRAEERLNQLASRDPLTGLLNRRRMWDRLEERRVQFQRHKRPFALVMADIDHFKRINDEHGHDTGDAVLREVSDLLTGALRSEDVIARWGGEEYLILLSESTRDGAVVVAEKLRRVIESHPFPALGERGLTMTFGVAGYNGDATLDECISRADAALYRGKSAGRNQVGTVPEKATRRELERVS